MGTRYDKPEGARLKVLTVSARIKVIAEDRSDVEIDPPDRRISTEDNVMETHSKSTNLEIRVPVGMNVSVGTVSGHVELIGRFGSVKASTVSGHVSIGDTNGEADIRSISGHIEVGECGDRCRANTKSGHIIVKHVVNALKGHTMSGNVEVGVGGGGEVEVKSISGRINVTVDAGRKPHARLKSLSGRCRCDIEQGEDFEIKASSISGSVEVQAR
ncbi:MAG: DUF4097 family beta strand repeat-containing protein [Chloroflexota bacterium]